MKQSLFLVRSVRSLLCPSFAARVKPRRSNSSEQHLRDADRCESRCCSARVWQSRHGVRVRQPALRGVLPEHICRGLRTGQRLWCKCRYASASISCTLMMVLHQTGRKSGRLRVLCDTVLHISAVSCKLHSLLNEIWFGMIIHTNFFWWIKTNLKTKFVFRRVPADSVSRQRRSVQRRPVFSVGVGLLWPVLCQTEQCPQT